MFLPQQNFKKILTSVYSDFFQHMWKKLCLRFSWYSVLVYPITNNRLGLCSVSEFCLRTWRAQPNTDRKLFFPSPVLPTFPLESEGQGITWLLLRNSRLHIHKVLSWQLKKHILTLTVWETVHVAGQRVYGKFLYLLLICCGPKIALNNKVY